MTDQWKVYKSKMAVIKFYADIAIGFMSVRKHFPYRNIGFSYSGYNYM